MWCIYTRGYHLSLKRKDILIHTAVRVNTVDATLNEMSHRTKGQILYDFIHMRYVSDSQRQKVVIAGGQRKGDGS